VQKGVSGTIRHDDVGMPEGVWMEVDIGYLRLHRYGLWSDVEAV